MVTHANMLKMKTVNIQNCSTFPFMLPQTLKETGCWHVSNSLKKSINIATTTLKELTHSTKLDYFRFRHTDHTVVLTLSSSHRFKEFEVSLLCGLRFSWLRFGLVLSNTQTDGMSLLHAGDIVLWTFIIHQQLELRETYSWATPARPDGILWTFPSQYKSSLPPPPLSDPAKLGRTPVCSGTLTTASVDTVG